MRRIAVINHKGGTGKTTTSLHLAAGLAEAGYRVLLVDFDPQGNVGVWFGVEPEVTIADLLVGRVGPEDAIQTLRANLDAILSDARLSELEDSLLGRARDDEMLRRALASVNGYEFCFVDCAPSMNVLTKSALVYADEVIIPISMEYLAMVGVRQNLENIVRVRERRGHPVQITAVIPTFFHGRNRKSYEIIDALRTHFGELLTEPIRHNVKLSEAPSHGKTVFEYAPSSRGALDYMKLVRRFQNG